jgi:O-antigen ligase
VRAAAGALVPLFALALQLSESRASWLALAVGLAATALLHPSSLSLMRTLAPLAPATAIAIWIGHHSELSSASSPRLSGLVVAIASAGCAVVAAGATTLRLPRLVSSPSSQTRLLVVAGTAVVALVGAVAVVTAGATEPRSLYYHVAWREFLAHPLFGSGAGTFGHYWLRWGDVGAWGGALDAHSLYLETLAELGPIGLGLLGIFLLYPLRRTVANRSRPFVPAAAGATIAFLVHAGLDWDWEMPAVVVAGLACAAVVAFTEPAGGDDEPSPTVTSAVRATALVAALLAGAAAIAGARSTTQPAARASTDPLTIEAPRSGASNRTTF